MKRNMLSAASAAALSLSLLAGAPGLAQGLDDATARGLAVLGFNAPAMETLSTEQVAQIQNVLASTDDDSVKRAHIEQILGNEATATGRLGVAQLRDSVMADLAELGVDTSAVDMLTLSQLAQIENVTSSTDSTDVKKGRINEIIGGEATATGRLGVQQLQDSVAADLATLGIDAEGVDMLTLSQLAQIENVMASTDADDQKRAQINVIMNE